MPPRRRAGSAAPGRGACADGRPGSAPAASTPARRRRSWRPRRARRPAHPSATAPGPRPRRGDRAGAASPAPRPTGSRHRRHRGRRRAARRAPRRPGRARQPHQQPWHSSPGSERRRRGQRGRSQMTGTVTSVPRGEHHQHIEHTFARQPGGEIFSWPDRCLRRCRSAATHDHRQQCGGFTSTPATPLTVRAHLTALCGSEPRRGFVLRSPPASRVPSVVHPSAS